MKILACNANVPLANKVASILNTELINATIKTFSDKEIFVEVNENVRGEDVFVIQSTSCPANENLMELLIAIDALKRASAKKELPQLSLIMVMRDKIESLVLEHLLLQN